MDQDTPLDETLITRSLDGDLDAFHLVVCALAPQVRRSLAVRGCRGLVLDELVQDSFVAAWEHRHQCRMAGNFRAWVLTIARNQLARHARKRLREHHLDGFERTLAERLVDAAESDEPDARLAPLRRCLETLGPQARALLDAYYGDGGSVAQLAERFGRSLSWVKVTLHRTRAALRRCIDRSGIDHA